MMDCKVMICCIVTFIALTGKEYWCKNVFHCCDWLNSRNHSKKEIPMQNWFALLCLIALQRTLHWHKALLWILLLNFHDWLYCHDLLPYHKNLLQPRLGLLEDRAGFPVMATFSFLARACLIGEPLVPSRCLLTADRWSSLAWSTLVNRWKLDLAWSWGQ